MALDYCRAFTIVLADGTVRRVCRPGNTDCGAAGDKDNDDLFFAVLGGGPGSFGIVVEYELDFIRDEAHLRSWGYKNTLVYDKLFFRQAMKFAQNISRSLGDPSVRIPSDADMCFTVASSEGVRPSAFLFELVYGDNGTQVDPASFFNPLINELEAQTKHLSWKRFLASSTDYHGPKPLSFMANSFVRREGMGTTNGREFPYPYHKRVNGVYQALPDAFVDRLVDQIDKTINTADAYLVFQMFMGGGMHRDNPRRNQTALPHRDISFGFVYDIFYKNEKTALALQADMTKLLQDTLVPEGDSVRFLWGSFDNTDMTNPEVQRFYYSDPTGSPYARLAGIKHRFDPNDLFHTSFTVQPPGTTPGTVQPPVPREDL